MTNEEINFKTEENCTDCKWEGTLTCECSEYCVANTNDFEKKQSNSDEDCISRQAVLECIRDNYRRWFINDDDFMQCVNEIRNIVPVAPKPKTGRWELVQRGKYIDICCSECKHVRVKEYAYNYKIYQLDEQETKGFIANSHMKFCECCGAKMEVQE